MLIFVVTPLFPNKYNQQHGIYVYEQCLALKEQGNKVVVLDISPFNWKKWTSKSCKEIETNYENGLEVYSMHPRGLLTSKLPRYAVSSAWNRLKKLYDVATEKHGSPDIFHAHFTFTAGYLTKRLSDLTGIPFIVTEHYSLFLKSELHPFVKNILHETIQSATKFICVSNRLKTSIEGLTGSKNIEVIPNLVDKRFRFYPIEQNDNKFYFFSAGNLVASKRFDLLINSFCSAFSKDDKVYLNIAGAGKEYKKLKDLITSKDREGQVTLLGRLNRDEMLKQYINSNCFVLASDYETFGIVFREAMAVGRPVISTENGGIDEGWDDSFGKLVPLDDENSLSKSLKDVFLNHPYNNRYISECTLEKYSFDEIGKKVNNLLGEIVSLKN